MLLLNFKKDNKQCLVSPTNMQKRIHICNDIYT